MLFGAKPKCAFSFAPFGTTNLTRDSGWFFYLLGHEEISYIIIRTWTVRKISFWCEWRLFNFMVGLLLFLPKKPSQVKVQQRIENDGHNQTKHETQFTFLWSVLVQSLTQWRSLLSNGEMIAQRSERIKERREMNTVYPLIELWIEIWFEFLINISSIYPHWTETYKAHFIFEVDIILNMREDRVKNALFYLIALRTYERRNGNLIKILKPWWLTFADNFFRPINQVKKGSANKSRKNVMKHAWQPQEMNAI